LLQARKAARIMHRFRALVLKHRGFAALVLALALCLKLVVPTGMMLDSGPHQVTVRICSEQMGLASIALPTSGKAHHQGDGKADSMCPYSVLGHATLGGADPVLLALAIAFILALGFLAVAPVRRARFAHVLPPACGPPALV